MIWNAYDSNAGAMRKMDFQKAFDWSFVRGALDSLGFAGTWIRWMAA